MKDLQCMSFTSKGASEIIVAGWQDTMFVIDVVKGEIVKHVGSPWFDILSVPRRHSHPPHRSLPSITILS